MKKVIALIVFAVTFNFAAQAQHDMAKDGKQKTQVISLQQTPGEFTQKELTVSQGTYIFEIENNQAAPEVGFVLVPKGKDATNPENHIKTAYVTEVVKKGSKQNSNVTTLTRGEYVYFCPLNKTPQYTLKVE